MMDGSNGDDEEGARNPLAALPDVYSRRKRLARGSFDPLQCDHVPHKVRVQILHVAEGVLKVFSSHFHAKKEEFFKPVRDALRTELGVFQLARANSSYDEVTVWFTTAGSIEEVVDGIELICRRILSFSGDYSNLRATAPARIQEINGRLFEAGCGFQYEGGRVIEANSKYLHAQVVVPALELLSDAKYGAANAEFLAAHDAFREGDYEQCLVECCKAFESVIKVIAAERDWQVPSNAPAKTLVKAVFDNGLIPNYMESEFAGIRTVLESGIGTVRNKAGGHGAGTEVRVVPKHLASFQLHQTGAAITLLAEAHAAV